MNRIKLLEYSKLNNTTSYDVVMKHMNPVNSLAGGKIDLNKLSYKDVRSCLHLMKSIQDWEGQKELFCLAFSVPEHSHMVKDTLIFDKEQIGFWDVFIDEFFAAQNYLIKTFQDLQKRETKLLQSIDADTGKWSMAGGDRLNKFSNLMPLVQLGEIYSIYPYDLQNKPYNEILTLLVLHKEKAEINNAYSKLKSK